MKHAHLGLINIIALSMASCGGASDSTTLDQDTDLGLVTPTPTPGSTSIPIITPSPSPLPTPTPSSNVVANIKASRTECASPCTVVFSAEDSSADGFDEHEVWRNLSYYWDFDTGTNSTYAELYKQNYEYVSGDTSYEAGFAPMVTKTFLCATGTCIYNVGLRAQNELGDYGDEFQQIVVQSESERWPAMDTVCVSNTLDLNDNWTSFDKACPSSAAKQAVMPDADAYEGKLILLKKGDVFDQNLAQWASESNFKIGYFGNVSENKPEITGRIWLGSHGINGPSNAPTGNWSFANNASYESYGWPENIYIEGLKTGSISFPMSSQHVGIHDIDMDRELYADQGNIDLSRGRQYCTDFPDVLSCSNVPFSKGVYISNVDVVGGLNAEDNVTALNVSGIGCDMSNYTGIVNSRFRKTGEHNLRIMGWWRLSIMRNQWLGQHYSPGKQKITTRPCFGGIASDEHPEGPNANPLIPDTWDDDPEGRTRADLFWDFEDDYIHVSRYQATIGNQIGDPGVLLGSSFGSTKVQTNVTSGYEPLVRDVIYSKNVFYNESGNDSIDISAAGWYVTCRDNIYADNGRNCTPSSPAEGSNMLSDPSTFAYPDPPSR